MRVRLVVRLLRLVIVVGLLPVLSLTAKACAPACVGGSVSLAADGGWDWLTEPGGPMAEGPKKPQPYKNEGGFNAKGNGGGNVKKCKSGRKQDGTSTMRGANGTKIQSQTLANGEVRTHKWRIDVENPAPGKRPGSLHVQLGGKGSKHYEYDNGKFVAKDGAKLPNKVQKNIDNSPEAQNAIRKGLRFLGEG